MPISKQDAIAAMFHECAVLDNSMWNLQLAPPGNQYHNPESIEVLAESLTKMQRGLSCLKRALKRDEVKVVANANL